MTAKRGNRFLASRGSLVRATALAVVVAMVVFGLPAASVVYPRIGAVPAPVPVSFDTCGSDPGTDNSTTPGTLSPPPPEYQQVVSGGGSTPQEVAFDGAQATIGAGALPQTTTIGVAALDGIATDATAGQVPPLDGGMADVTGGHDGYQFTPHPMQFAKDIELTLPYDPSRLPDGFTAQDVYTYFYDDAELCWKALTRKSVDVASHTVTSWTSHFTDFINSTVTAPDQPENVSFNPNQIKGIQAADPGTGVTLLAAPQATNQGDNTLSYPIEVPPGRLGLQPSVSIGYQSSGGDGWLGAGWNLQLPSISVDTRFGVPRYEAATETETYTFNGDQLTPMVDRVTAVARTPEKVFHTRVEGGFDRIVRHGNSPTTYTWEVVDKTGTHFFFGAPPGASGPEDGATLSDRGGDVFLWALREVRDAHGNDMRYEYAKVADEGLAPGSKHNTTEPGSDLYPKKITYTGFGTDPGQYAVTFTRDRDLGEPRRSDVVIDARGGFKRVTADRLRRVDVTFGTALVRRYDLAYTTGAFDKTLLKTITQLDADGHPVGVHTFGYFDDIRDTNGAYQAFKQADWAVPGDGLSNGVLNLTGRSAEDASSLGATSNSSSGEHVYVGFGEETDDKVNSGGVKLGSGHTSDDGVLALVDVDGDNLPDKVFRGGGGVVWYRKNLSKPGGQPGFDSTPHQLTLAAGGKLPGIGRADTDSDTRGLEAYFGRVAAQLDQVDSSTTTSQYFADVNGDGIADLVVGTSVLFGRIGPNQTPVYGVSDDTPVKVTAGQIDTSGILANLTNLRSQLTDSFPLVDSVRRWIAPYPGTVRVSGPVKLAASTAGARSTSTAADGVRVAVQRNGDELWAQTIGATDTTSYTPSGVNSVSVAKGDRLYFRVGSRDDGSLDQVDWDPVVEYTSSTLPTDVNGLLTGRYQPSADFTLAGRASRVKAPLTGTLHVDGDVHASAALTDDVTVQVTRDGTPVFQQTIAAGTASATVPVSLDVSVQKGQTLVWRLRTDSPIDLHAISWTPHAAYTAADGVDHVNDPSGTPLIAFFPPYQADMYPVDASTAPQGFFSVPVDGQVMVSPTLSFNFNGQQPSGLVTFTVKRPHALVGKGVFGITNGAVHAPDTLFLDVHGGDALYFDFSTTDPVLQTFLTGHAVNLSFFPSPDIGIPIPEINNEAEPNTFHSAATEDAFPQPYRGWGGVGYNANGDKRTQPIAEGDLVIDESYKDGLPDDSFDPQHHAPVQVSAPKVIPFGPSPRDGLWGVGQSRPQDPPGTGVHIWVGPGGASSSRLGTESISLPHESDFSTAQAVPRLATSSQLSLTGSVNVTVATAGGSVADGDSSGQLDFLDMNGDGFPDVLSPAGIQYTDRSGGLTTKHGSLPDGAVRGSHNRSGNANAGSAARTIVTGLSDGAPSGTRTANTSTSGGDLAPFGSPVSVGGTLGGSTSRSDFDLLDINGDGLPDRVYADGQVALNLGYTFAEVETWPNSATLNTAKQATALNDGSGGNGGVNLGFNTDFYSFAGGASYQEGSTSASATLVDVNGDGLLDRVFAGNPITVAFNTGAGFDQQPVELRGGLTGLNADQNASLGGGVYFTIPICFVFGCIIINPGGDGSVGASRTTQELRDINGDGFVDQLSSTKDNQLRVAENQTGKTNLLATVSRPMGGRMSFDYTRDGNTYDLPQSRYVLSRVSLVDGQPGDGADTQTTTFAYSGGVYDRLQREFDGYATVVARQVDPGASDAVLRSVTRTYHTDGHYTRGLLATEVTADGAGHRFLETDNTYTLRNVDDPSASGDPHSTTATIFPALTRTDRTFFEGQANPGKTTFTTTDYDAVGNVTESFDAGEAGGGDDVDAKVSYTQGDPACRTTGITGTANVIDVFGGGVLSRHRESTVDCTTGDITQVRAKLANGDTAVTNLSYQGNGNLATAISPANQTGQHYRRDYTYDGDTNSHVASVTDNFGYTSSMTYDPRFGAVATATDENHQVVSNTYDAAGRLVTVVGPYETGQNRATIAFEYHPEAGVPYAVTRHVDRQADGTVRDDTIDTITFTDGLDRVIQTKTDAAVSTGPNTAPADVMDVSGRVVFDALGRTVRQFYPVTEPKGSANTTLNPAFDPVAPTVTTYDVLDRVTATVLPDNTTTAMAYGFGPNRSGLTQFETVATDANGKATRTYTDVRQHITSVKQSNPTGGHPVVWTSYAYDALGQLTRVVDDHNNSTTATYDNFGRRTSITDPDTGETDSVFDLAGNLVKKITPKLAGNGQAIQYDYDVNRLTAIRYPVFTANNVTYTYGAPGAADNGANRIVSVTDAAGTVTRKYGPLGEVTSQTRTTTAQNHKTVSFTTQYQFDTWNRVLALTYPDGEVLSYRYNSGGQVEAATGVKGGFTYSYLTRMDYDKFGQRVLADTGNGTRTQYGYDSANRRLASLKANLAQGYLFENLNYSYDNVGNITQVVNDTVAPSSPDVGTQVGGPSTQTFSYDDLNELVHAQGSYQPRTPPQTDTYNLDLTYDSIGNITDKAQVHQLVSNGNTVTDGKLSYTYDYGYTGAGPHQAVTIGGFTFAYDADGNQISRVQQPGPRQQMIWDEEDRLACSHANKPNTLPQTPASCDNAGGTPNDARYLYDDQGNRIVKDSAQLHIYPNQNYSTNGNFAYKHVFIADTKLVTKTVEKNRFEDQQFYSHGDQLGSVGFITDSGGGLAEHLQYLPAGETWVDEHPSQPVPQEFTGKEIDPETNLYYYGARYYDPRTQQWQTADPIVGSYLDGKPNQGVYNPTNLALYTYARNNPVRYTDPDGRQPADAPGTLTPQQKAGLLQSFTQHLSNLQDKLSHATDPADIARIKRDIVQVSGDVDEIRELIGPVRWVQTDGLWHTVPAGQADQSAYIQVDGKWKAVPAGSVTYIQIDGKWKAVPANSVRYIQVDGEWKAVPKGLLDHTQIDHSGGDSTGPSPAVPNDQSAPAPSRAAALGPADLWESLDQ